MLRVDLKVFSCRAFHSTRFELAVSAPPFRFRGVWYGGLFWLDLLFLAEPACSFLFLTLPSGDLFHDPFTFV